MDNAHGAILAAVLFGLVPGLRISSGNLQEALKDSGHGTSEGRKHEGMRAVLVISEVALASVLLVGAGLLLRSFLRILDVDLGFQPSRAASISLDYNEAERCGEKKRDLAGGYASGRGDSGNRNCGHHRQYAHEPESKLGNFSQGQKVPHEKWSPHSVHRFAWVP